MRKLSPLIPEGVKEKLVITVNNISVQICGYKHLGRADDIPPMQQWIGAKNKYVSKSNRGLGWSEVMHQSPWKSQLTEREIKLWSHVRERMLPRRVFLGLRVI